MKEGWREARLKEISSFERGLTYKKGDEVALSGNVVLRANNVDLATGSLDLSELRHISDAIEVPPSKIVRRGSLIVCTASGSKSHLGKVAFIDDDYGYAFGGFMGQITPSAGVDAKFLYWLTRSHIYSDFIAELSDGANINNLKFKQLGALKVPLPPLPEQKRIVAILDEAFEGIGRAVANAEKNLANARELFESVVSQCIERANADADLVPLASICENLDAKRVPITKSKRLPGDVPYYGASGEVDRVRDYLFNEELLLVSEDGANLLARTYPIAFSISGPSWVNNHAHVLRFANADMQNFVELFLNSISLEPWVSGMAQPKLNQKALNSIPVPGVDVKFAATVVAEAHAVREASRELQTIGENRLAMLDAVKQSILAKAFSGELSRDPDRALAETGA